VLIRFWNAYREHPIFAAADAAEVLRHARRCLKLLADGRDFNVTTNHGVMSNVALMQLVLAFPGLGDDSTLMALAESRLRSQVGFLYAPDGFVLEHSAHYHDVGVRLLAQAIDLLKLADRPLPPGWVEQLEASRRTLALLTRPDGTLPAVGDTEVELVRRAAATVPTPSGFHIFPISGYAVWGFGPPSAPLSHSVAAWSHFPSHGHKLADEMSLNLWADGRGWVTNTGYWDYGGWGRAATEGWRGGNAPHWVDEAATDTRQTALRAYAASERAAFLELDRSAARGQRLNRQVLSLADRIWLVVDRSAVSANAPAETLWTFYPDLVLTPVAAGRWLASDPVGRRLGISVLSASGQPGELVIGSRSPFAGWVALGRAPAPSSALRLPHPRGEWSATLFTAGELPQDFTFNTSSDTDWTASVGNWSAQRHADTLMLQHGDRNEVLALQPGPDVGSRRADIARRFAVAQAAYPRALNVDRYRDRAAQVLLLLLLLQEGLLLALARERPARVAARLSGALVAGWLAGGLWLQLAYFG
jgi:hypothetical protein